MLGTGGLTRAYSQGCKGAVELAGIVEMTECSCFDIECDYGFYNTLQSIFMKFSVETEKSDFADSVKLSCFIKDEDFELLKKEIAEKFSGKIVPKFTDKKYFGFNVK